MADQKATKKANIVDEIVGWYGTAAILGAYALNSFSILNVSNPWYQILNGTGSIGILIISLKKKVYQSVALNAIWTCIAVLGLIQIFSHHS